MEASGTRVEVVILGSGTSHGVPMIGCDCRVCTSGDPRDKRTRCSILVQFGQLRLLVDTAPELRLQCVAQGVARVDAILLTHHHADHLAGMDDVRRFNWLMRRAIPLYGTERSLAAAKRMFPYAFGLDSQSAHSRPELEPVTIDDQPFEIDHRRIVPIPLRHGPTSVLGFRFGDFAYCTDCNEIPTDSLERLRGLDVLILDALRHTPHPAHFNLEQAVEMAGRIGAKQTYFTHIAHEILHASTTRDLPAGVHLAYDGLRLSIGH